MRLGVSIGRGGLPTVTGKRNNWRPTPGEPEMPECLEHLASGITKVGETMTVPHGHPHHAVLVSFARGEQPHEMAILKEAKVMVDNLSTSIDAACRRLRRRGIRLRPYVLVHTVNRLARERHEEQGG